MLSMILLLITSDSKKRYRADVLIEEEIAKIDDKIEKEVAKARKRFGESFDEALYRETNPRVVEYKAKRDALHERFSQAMNDNDLAGLRQIIIDQEIVCPISGTKTGQRYVSSILCSRPRWALQQKAR